MVALAVVLALVHRVQEVGSDVCAREWACRHAGFLSCCQKEGKLERVSLALHAPQRVILSKH